MQRRHESQDHQMWQREGTFANLKARANSSFAEDGHWQELAKSSHVVLTNLLPYLTPHVHP